MSPLKVTRRDDPLAISADNEALSPDQHSTSLPRHASTPGAQPAPAPPGPREPVERDREPGAPDQTGVVAVPMGSRGPYDDDQLVQTGWRIYESLVQEVASLSGRLNEDGVAASRASLVAAVLHRYLPRDLEDAEALLREFRQASAGRSRPG